MFTAGQAAKAAGVSKTTISNALRSGRLSYVEKTKAGYVIDPAELARVFPKTSNETAKVDSSEPSMDAVFERQIADLRDMLSDMRNERDQWREQAQRLALTHERKRGLFGWLKGK